MGFELTGVTAMLSDIEKMIPTDTDVDGFLAEGAEPIRAEMERRAPVLSGNLKKAVKVGNVRTTKRGRTITIGVHRRDIKLPGPDEYYPAYVEYGHGGPHPADAHPFIRPAYDTKRDEAWTAIKQAAIEKLGL